MKLLDYLKLHSIKGVEFSRRLKTTEATVSFWINGKKVPSIENMRRIYEVTNGEVTANDFYNTPQKLS